MTTPIPQAIGKLLGELGSPGSFSARWSRPPGDLHLEIEDIGPIELPVSPEQAEALCEHGRPARYGQGEKTLLDLRVRHTWEIPKERVRIDEQRWARTLQPALDKLGAGLGLLGRRGLKAELHAMLVYAPGHFFLPHQDTEKDDSMVGTLTVTLPSSFEGGALVVEHQDGKATFRGSEKNLSFVAFYADCRHQVQPVKRGHRVVLTYNLMLEERDSVAGSDDGAPDPETVATLAELLREYFESPLPPRWEWSKSKPPEDPPARLIYLLDHQYTERGFGWERLKGNDATRVAALRAAAERYGCETVLALTEIHESWHCLPSEPAGFWERERYGRHRSWHRDEDDEWIEDDPPETNDPDAYDLQELIDSEIELTRWIDAPEDEPTAIATHVDPRETAASTPTVELPAHASEYEGYMGNWGNTMDRWYRRAAVVLWPRELAFAVRAEASPAWALDTLGEELRSGRLDEAREMVDSLRPFWRYKVTGETREGFFARVLAVAEGLGTPSHAATLLVPFRIENLGPAEAPAFVALARRYGEEWIEALVEEWSDLSPSSRDDASRPWCAELPVLCHALTKADPDIGPRCTALLLGDRWHWLSGEIDGAIAQSQPSWQARRLVALASPLAGFLESLELLGLETLREEVVSFLCHEDRSAMTPILVHVLRLVANEAPESPSTESLRQWCIEQLEARLAKPARASDDWTITLPDDCTCEDCRTLRAFLADPSAQQLAWPIAKARRRHIHNVVDSHELPVNHTTRRKGSPYTLVLTKTRDLHQHEAEARQGWQRDLEWLTGTRE